LLDVISVGPEMREQLLFRLDYHGMRGRAVRKCERSCIKLLRAGRSAQRAVESGYSTVFHLDVENAILQILYS
jgi:hypothetical protein